MIKKLINFCKDEEGATMVEYGLMVALIAVACIAAVTLIGTDLAACSAGFWTRFKIKVLILFLKRPVKPCTEES